MAAKVAASTPDVKPVILSDLLPDRWTTFVRKGPIEDVRAIGTVSTP